MNPLLEFHVDGIPKPKGSVSALAPGIIRQRVKGSKAWQRKVTQVARVVANQASFDPLTGPVGVTLIFRMPCPVRGVPKVRKATLDFYHAFKRPDLDKLIRNILDALEGVAWDEDSRVARIHADKTYATKPEGVDCDEGGPGVYVQVYDIDHAGRDV